MSQASQGKNSCSAMSSWVAKTCRWITEELATLTVKRKNVQIYAFLKNRKEIFEIVYFNTMMLAGKKLKMKKHPTILELGR